MRVVVAGDVVVDHHVYEGERSNPAQTDCRGVSVVREYGGAKALTDLIEQMFVAQKTRLKTARDDAAREYQEKLQEFNESKAKNKKPPKLEAIDPNPLEDCSVDFCLSLPDKDSLPCGHHGLAIFKPYPETNDNDDRHFWRANALLGFGHDNPEPADTDSKAGSTHCNVYQPEPEMRDPGDVLILDDAGYMFRKDDRCWLLKSDETPSWIILKQSAPVCRGKLWKDLKKHQDRLVVVVSVTELRQESISISKGLSWERTVEDLVTALKSNSYLDELRGCRHLVISFSADGALWLDNGPNCNGPQVASLIYDPASIEGQWAEQTDGEVFGYMSCMVAAVTKSLIHQVAEKAEKTQKGIATDITPDFASALSTGLATMRNLRSFGHGEVPNDPPAGYPAARLSEVLVNPTERFSICGVPWENLSSDSYVSPSWEIAVQAQMPIGGSKFAMMPMSGLAQEVVRRGRRVLTGLPHATFGGLFTIDRIEIETLRTLRGLMKDYRSSPVDSKPLSIGVFGPPGAGKSFGVKQIATEVFGPKAWLEFNLSQFRQEDLTGALHIVRDKVLELGIPVVFWDEFDSKNYSWLQYLLAPMQDGRFQEGQVSHPIGRCIFIFAGATSSTFQNFGVSEPDPLKKDKGEIEQWEAYKLLKGPDFMSRLDGYYNVLGPNPRELEPWKFDPKDRCFSIRRSLMLRHFLCGKAKDQLDIDPGLLRALLEVPKYRNGARSLEKLSQTLKPKKPSGPILRSDLCSPTQLAMFIDFPGKDKKNKKKNKE